VTELDERLYGIAPKERDAHDGVVYLTMVGVLKKLKISESTLRRNAGLMALRRVIGPGTYRWHPNDIDEYSAAQKEPLPDVQTMKKNRRRKALGHHGIAEGRKRGQQRDAALQATLAAKMQAYHAQGAEDA
jgi:hypothetical protein